MKQFKYALAIAALCAAPLTNATTINFEDLSSVGQSGSVAFNRYSASGVTFGNSISYAAYNHPAGGANLPGWSLYNSSKIYGDISGSFSAPVSSMSILVGDWCCDADSATLSVYDASNNLLGTVSGAGSDWFTLAISAAGISRFSIESDGAVLYDNLTFSDRRSSVPEPASLALLGLGLAGAFAARRRKQA